MIVLDAAVLIAVLDPDDAHHRVAVDLIDANAHHDLAMNQINLAEALVTPARRGALPQALAAVDGLDIEVIPVPHDGARRLAQLRAETGSKMPDCCALLTAQQHNAALATFDDRLRRSAATLGVSTL